MDIEMAQWIMMEDMLMKCGPGCYACIVSSTHILCVIPQHIYNPQQKKNMHTKIIEKVFHCN